MRALLLALIFGIHLFASAILNYEFYPRSDRFDLMITFNKAYEGEIKRQTTPEMILITLKDASIYENVQKSFDNRLVNEIRIYQDGQDVNIAFITNLKLNLTASRASQGMGLRFRLKEDVALKPQETQNQIAQTQETKELPHKNSVEFKEDNIDFTRYLLVLGFLGVMIIILLIIKKRVGSNETKSWLFNSMVPKNSDIKVISQKQLDMKNRVVIFEVGRKQYTVLIGQNSYLLLDKTEFSKKKSEFESILDENQERLNSFLELENKRYDDLNLENYKKRAGMLYDE